MSDAEGVLLLILFCVFIIGAPIIGSASCSAELTKAKVQDKIEDSNTLIISKTNNSYRVEVSDEAFF